MFSNSVLNIERMWALLLLVLFLVLIIVITYYRKNTLTLNLFQQVPKKVKIHRYLLYTSYLCIVMVLVLLILTTAGITRVTQKNVIQSEEVYILFALDLSPSMAAQDINSKSRWEATLESLSYLFRNVQNKKIGIMIFADSMSMVIPFTDDYQYVQDVLQTIVLGELGNETALADAILFSQSIYESIAHNKKIVVVVTDGNQNSGDISLEETSVILKNRDHNMTLLHIGSNTSAPFQYHDIKSKQIISGVFNPAQKNIIKPFAEQSDISYVPITDLEQLNSFMIRIINSVSNNAYIKVLSYNESLDALFILIAGIFFLLFLFIRHIILRVLW